MAYRGVSGRFQKGKKRPPRNKKDKIPLEVLEKRYQKLGKTLKGRK
jgi:hypothetical protein